MTTPNILEKLDSLSACRTARTDRLHAAVDSFLTRLAQSVEVGDYACVSGCTLSRVRVRTNVGTYVTWNFHYDGFGKDDDEDASDCDPTKPVGESGYVHGDFNAEWTGPTRDDLIALAQRSAQFAAEFAREHQAAVDALEQAIAQVGT